MVIYKNRKAVLKELLFLGGQQQQNDKKIYICHTGIISSTRFLSYQRVGAGLRDGSSRG